MHATDAASNSTSYGRDPFGNLSTVTDPNSNVVRITYDRLGRRINLNDPDLGLATEKVDPPGRTWWSQSANQKAAGTSTTINFDVLDRVTHRLEPDLESYWVFDTSAHGVGQLAEAYTWVAGTNSKNFDRVSSYDALGRPSKVVTSLDASYTTSDAFDAYGRPSTTTHQRGAVSRSFTRSCNAMGFESQLTNESGQILWQETAQDAWGHEKTAIEGALAVTRNYDGHTTNLSNATWSVAASGQERYRETNASYDVLNNLTQRSGRWNFNDPNVATPQASYQDVFSYDTMNRLWTATAWTQPKETFTYDAIGNLTSKTSVANGGLYGYPTGASAVRPHAVQSIATYGSYGYDGNGNLLSAPNSVSATWTSFDMPLVLTKGANSDTFVYGPEHERIKQVRNSGTTLYYAGAMEIEVSGSNVTTKTYWPGGLGVTIDAPAGVKLLWTPADRLGDVRAYIDASGSVVEMLDYDAWGKRRNATGIGTPDTLNGVTDNKGFTGHEMLDNLDLVHMNGRIYDPLIGRFMTPDPLVQSPENSQSYNRYSYVWNNPTNLTDPTGFAATDCPKESICEVKVTTHRDFNSAAIGAKTTTTTTTTTLSNGSKVTVTSIATTNSLGQTTVSEKRSVSGEAKGGNTGSVGYQGLTQVDEMGNPCCGNPMSGDAQKMVGTAAAAATVPVGGSWLASFQLGRLALISLGLIADIQAGSDGLPMGGGFASVEAGSIRGVNAIEGKMNCVNCVVATDATLAGRQASALGGGPFPISVLEKTYGARFGTPTSIGSVSDALSAAGPGARGIVFGSRGAGEVGHVFNGVNQNGVVRYLDGQIGKAASLDGYKSFQLLRTN